MKRFIIPFILLFALTAHADVSKKAGLTISDYSEMAGQTIADLSKVAGQTIASATCDTTNVIFWWRCEDATLNGDCIGAGNPLACCSGADAGTCDYSAGDTTGTVFSGAVFNTDAVKYGTNGLDLPTLGGVVAFTPITATMDEQARIGMWVRLTTFTDTRRLFSIYYVGERDYIRLKLDGTDELELTYDYNYTTRTATTTGADLATGTWYFIEAYWNTTTDTMGILVNGVSKGTYTGTVNPFTDDADYMYIGDGSGTAQDTHIDNIIISTDSTVDLYTTCKDEAEWPE